MDEPSRSFWSGATACVLGGNGFLGRHLVAQLLAAGARVRTLSLAGPKLPSHPQLDARIGDATNAQTVRYAADGAQVVFLAAGPVGVGGALSRTMDAHVSVLERTLDAIPSDARLVLTSSIVAVGATPQGQSLDEMAPFPNARLRVNYVQAKRAAEEAALGTGRDLVVVNPGYLFGPDDPGPSVMGDLCLRVWRGRLAFGLPGGLNAVDVRDVAAGHLLAAERGAAGRRYILGGENIAFPQLLAEITAAAGRRHRVFPSFRPALPGWAFWLMAALAEAGAKVQGGNPAPSFEFVRMQRLFWYVSSARAMAELGYHPRPLAETLTDAFEWHSACTRAAPRGLNRLWFAHAHTRGPSRCHTVGVPSR